MSSDLLVGIDVGTTLCKAALVTLAGQEVAHGSCRTPWEAVATGAEVDPNRLFGAVVEAVHAALRPLPDAHVVAVGVTSMAETGILLDARGAPVAPAIAWHDRRGEEEARRLADELGPDRFTAATGLRATRLPSMVKYRWLRDHELRAAEGARWLTVAEWIVHELGGEPPAELSLASRTGFLDVAWGRWWDEALDWADAPAGLLAEPAVAGTPAGRSRGIRPLDGAVLTVAGHDHLCAVVGAGATRPGDLFDSCGTAEALVRALQPPVAEAAVHRAVDGGLALGWHVVEGRRALHGGFLCGLVLQRASTSSASTRTGWKRSGEPRWKRLPPPPRRSPWTWAWTLRRSGQSRPARRPRSSGARRSRRPPQRRPRSRRRPRASPARPGGSSSAAAGHATRPCSR